MTELSALPPGHQCWMLLGVLTQLSVLWSPVVIMSSPQC